MTRTTEQTNHASRSTATADEGETFVDPGTLRDVPAGEFGEGYHPTKEHTLDDELSELGKGFPQVAELLRTAVKYLA